MTIRDNLIKIILDIESYQDINFNKTVSDRLDKVLWWYLSELDRAYNKVYSNLDVDSIVKELNK